MTYNADDIDFALLLKARLGYSGTQCSSTLSTPECDWSAGERSLLHDYVLGEAHRRGIPTTITGSQFTAVKIPKKSLFSNKPSIRSIFPNNNNNNNFYNLSRSLTEHRYSYSKPIIIINEVSKTL